MARPTSPSPSSAVIVVSCCCARTAPRKFSLQFPHLYRRQEQLDGCDNPGIPCRARLHGAALARGKFRPSAILFGATIIGCSIALPLVVGFGLKGMGVAVPWRPPAGSLGGAIVGNWLFLAVLILTAYGLGRLALYTIPRRRAVDSLPPARPPNDLSSLRYAFRWK